MYKLANFLIIFLIGVYSSFLINSGNIGLYINPRYFQLSEFASIVCLFVGALGLIYHLKNFQFRIRFSLKEFKNIFNSYFFVIIFFVFAFGFAPKTLSSNIASSRSTENGFFQENFDSIFDTFKKTDESFNINDWVSEIAKSGDIYSFEGRKVDVVGFVFRDNTKSDEFRVGRFIIRCCIVDATPISLLVKSDKAQNFEDNSWVRVRGTFIVEDEILKVQAGEIEKVEKPDSPYYY
ncbi:MAG: phosphate ABC transporter substrate-binding protein [Candidatus Dojkabacteria bacterium]|nr:MAG: phosphate ABC transporter substrate-binding protein [Candidatus Dojkabacteria bacterium]